MTASTTKGYIGMGMEGPIATWYANTTKSQMPDFQRLAYLISETAPQGGKALEVAPGPGYLAIELARLGRQSVVGLDISASFVRIARQKAAAAGVHVDFQQGNASQMPFGGNSFDFIVCRAAFKNFADPIGALNEMYRVLKPGGQAIINDLRNDASETEVNRHVDSMGLSAVSSLFTKGAFKFMLLKRAYTTDAFQALVAQSRFGSADIQRDGIGMDVWLKKV